MQRHSTAKFNAGSMECCWYKGPLEDDNRRWRMWSLYRSKYLTLIRYMSMPLHVAHGRRSASAKHQTKPSRLVTFMKFPFETSLLPIKALALNYPRNVPRKRCPLHLDYHDDRDPQAYLRLSCNSDSGSCGKYSQEGSFLSPPPPLSSYRPLYSYFIGCKTWRCMSQAQFNNICMNMCTEAYFYLRNNR